MFALQRMERNTLFVEEVPEGRLGWGDKLTGFVAWLLAQGGLLISSPAFFCLMLLAGGFGRFFEYMKFRILAEMHVTPDDRASAVEVVEECYVGENLGPGGVTWGEVDAVLRDPNARWSINLHTLLDNTGPSELYNLLSLHGLRP